MGGWLNVKPGYWLKDADKEVNAPIAKNKTK